MTKSRYADYPGHPLEEVPQEVLDVARDVLSDAAVYNDVDVSMVRPIADAVVQALKEGGYLKW